MNKITLSGENANISIELVDQQENINDVLELLIKPALLAYGFTPKTLDSLKLEDLDDEIE